MINVLLAEVSHFTISTIEQAVSADPDIHIVAHLEAGDDLAEAISARGVAVVITEARSDGILPPKYLAVLSSPHVAGVIAIAPHGFICMPARTAEGQTVQHFATRTPEPLVRAIRRITSLESHATPT